MSGQRWTFNEWLKRVDRIIHSHIYTSLPNVPRSTFQEYYDAGLTPAQAAEAVLAEGGYL